MSLPAEVDILLVEEAFARALSELGLFWLLLNEQPR